MDDPVRHSNSFSQHFQNLCRRPVQRLEGIDHPDRTERLAVLQILGQQNLALAGLCSRDDEGVPPGKGIAFLQEPCVFQNGEINRNRLPRCQFPDKSTYSLDVESVRVLEALAQRWDVSKSEVLRRAIRIAATGGKPAGEGASLDTLDRLQTSLRERNVDVSQWAGDQKAERREAGR